MHILYDVCSSPQRDTATALAEFALSECSCYYYYYYYYYYVYNALIFVMNWT